MKNEWPNWNPETPVLQKLRAAAKLTNPEFEAALADEAANRMRRFLNGVRAYHDYPESRDVPEAPVIWAEGSTKLRDYNPTSPAAPVVVVVPSLINRFAILDLDLAPSFLRNLANQGFRPLVVDWDAPGEAEQDFGMDEYVQRLIAVLDFVKGSGVRGQGSEKKDSDHRPPTTDIHLFGYCMGGLLALALAVLRSDKIKSLTLMATPWDFHKPDHAAASQIAQFAHDMEPLLVSNNQLPVDVIQSLFGMLQPLQVLQKFTKFADMNPLSLEARKFVLVEDWLNDGVPLTAKVARACLRDWYGTNVTANNAWHIAGQVIDPAVIKMPCYAIVPGKDKIVPPESALPLVRRLPYATLHEPMSGHIGLLAGRGAAQQIWAPHVRWLSQHN